jgi:hypothetical protein
MTENPFTERVVVSRLGGPVGTRYRRVAAVKARPLTLQIVINPVREEAMR